MRVLFTTQPTLSHWHPLVPLAQAVERAGHEVAFAATPRLCSTIEAKGFRTFPAGRDDTPEERQQRREQMAGLNSHEELLFTLRNVFAGVRAERSLPDLLDIISDWRVDLVVRENTDLGGCIAAERAGIPHATVQITAPWAFFLDVVDAPVRRAFASVGLSPENPGDVLYRYLLLSPRPPSLWDPTVPVPATLRAFRYVGFNRSGDEGLPRWVTDLEKRPTVYATLGTFENSLTHVWQAILDGLRDEPVNLILTVGRNREPAEFGDQPANVHIERYIPQNLILPYCDLVLCHGGSGTMLDALSHGLPMVIMPFAADQPENARRCGEVGVARVIEPEGVSDLSQDIRESVREVLADPGYRQTAQRLRAEIEALPGLDDVVTLLESLR